MAVVTCDAISRGQCGLVSAIRHDTSHTVHPHPGHLAVPTPVTDLSSLLTLLPVSATILCFKEHLTPGKWPVWTCVPFRRFYLDGALLHITGFHDDHHLNPNLNCLWELRCGGILTEHRPYKVIITTLTVCVRCSDVSVPYCFPTNFY